MKASANPILQTKEQRDPTLFCTAFKRPRFYMFTRTEPEYVPSFFRLIQVNFTLHSFRDNKGGDRDVFNEKPTREEQSLALQNSASVKTSITQNSPYAQAATIHTTMGDIHLKLFPEHVPKTVENFVGLVRKGYYEDIIFHRVIKKFVRVSSSVYVSARS